MTPAALPLGLKTLAGLALAVTFATSSVAQTPTPCPANFPAAGVVRAVGNYFPLNGRFYVMGGRSADTAGSDFTNPFEYNPTTNTWVTKVAPYPDNQVNNMACGVLTVGGTPQIYCVGGSASGATVATSRVFSYNPITDTITTLTAVDNWPGNVGGTILPGGFAVAGNKLYIIGGFNIGTGSTRQTWHFDPTAAVGWRWLQNSDYPLPRSFIPAAAIGGLIYTGGGSNIVGTTFTDTADSFRYDPAPNTWTPIAPIPRATGETRAVVINNQMLVLGGGRTPPNPSNEVDVYNPIINTWTIVPPLMTARRNFPADSDGGPRIWLVGGYDTGGHPLNTMEGVCATPSPTPTPASPTPTATATATATATGTPPAPTPTPTPTVTPTPSPSTTPAAQALNLSTRMRVQAGDNVGIGGFIITGTAPKQVLARGIGPSLTGFGVPDALADPVLELGGITNDNWMDTQGPAILTTGLAPTNDLESAILVTLNPGAYTAILKGKNNGTGVGLVEVYDLAQAVASKLANISTRAFVSTGGDIVIAGFILGNGTMADNVIVRGIGPSLAGLGVPNALADPRLELRNSNGTLLRADDNWQDDPAQAALITAAGLAPTNRLESAIAQTLGPGQYTALLAGVNNGTGVGLVEVYDLGRTP